MLGLFVSVPIACFRKGLAREYLETEPLPPPSTCYGFLLSLVGEGDRRKHIGARICPVLLNRPEVSVVLRTIWRVKKAPWGTAGNIRPDFQQLLSHVRLLLWLDSSDETASAQIAGSLEQRVEGALANPAGVSRFGGLSLGESSHLVDEVRRFEMRDAPSEALPQEGDAFLETPNGRLTLPVWVDHVGSAGTRYVTGDLVQGALVPPPLAMMPRISDR